VLDYIAAVRSESARFLELVRGAPGDAEVPSCPGWTVADLTWHLAEVQHFWGAVVADLLDTPESVVEPDRPNEADLPAFFGERSQRLVEVLESRHPADGCWSWHDAGHSVGWVRRRQAHEALIHRIDAELAAGTVYRIDAELAADGVDEVIRVMMDLDNLPEWAVYEPDGATAVVELDDGAAAWVLDLGRFKGASPRSGTAYDDAVVCLSDDAPAEPTATVRGSAADLDLWLWGRAPLDPITVVGDRTVADHIRAAAAAATQWGQVRRKTIW
jgi:uncharacterized protein (TIGR03083 family)